MMSDEMHSATASPRVMPKSDVSVGVGFAGLAGLFVWIMICRNAPEIAGALGVQQGIGVMSGPHAAVVAMLFTAGPMAVWSVLVDKVHLNASTGLDWNLKRSLSDIIPAASVKIAGLWATWAVLAGLYCVCRWYWDGNYLFAMKVLSFALIPMIVLSVPYILWLDRFMVDQRDSTWHFGAMLIAREEWDADKVKKHWRAWIIKGFFTAFMISILPFGFAQIVEASPSELLSSPIAIGGFLIAMLFMIDVMVGTAGYVFTLRPLDAHIRSGNPFLGGWLAALLCYPPFVWGLIGSNNQVLSYESNIAKWDHWLAGNETALWLWGGWLVFLTAAYAWATVAFGIRFSNLTYRGVITNGPYRYTRHPAYLSKNLFWWCSVMPFLVTSGSTVDAIRNTFFLLVVNAIYYWRARTEEAHLLIEDPKYRAYYDWMEENGVITAPLSRLKRGILRKGGFAAASPSARGAQPAE